jgi:hypothetical protein
VITSGGDYPEDNDRTIKSPEEHAKVEERKRPGLVRRRIDKDVAALPRIFQPRYLEDPHGQKGILRFNC